MGVAPQEYNHSIWLRNGAQLWRAGWGAPSQVGAEGLVGGSHQRDLAELGPARQGARGGRALVVSHGAEGSGCGRKGAAPRGGAVAGAGWCPAVGRWTGESVRVKTGLFCSISETFWGFLSFALR